MLPGHYETPIVLEEVRQLGADCPWALRRLKEDLRDMNGQRIFPDRHAVTVSFTLNAEEFALYEAVTGYINEFIPLPPGQQGRQQFSAVVRDYLEPSFKARINKAQERYMTLMGELGTQPEYKLAADEAKKYIEDLERTKKERLAGLDRLQIARTGPVRHLATAVVLNAEGEVAAQLGVLNRELDVDLRRRRELRAEEIVIDHLVAEGLPPENIQRVGNQKIGFDIHAQRVIDLTTGATEVRRIEVKGYTRGNDIQLTVNEWYKSQQLGPTYWLYVVWDPLEAGHELVRIHNPAEELDHAKKEIVVARMFCIPVEAITKCHSRGTNG